MVNMSCVCNADIDIDIDIVIDIDLLPLLKPQLESPCRRQPKAGRVTVGTNLSEKYKFEHNDRDGENKSGN